MTRRTPTDAENVRFTFGLRIPTEDGQFLSGIAYLPKKAEPVPAIVELNPYVGDSRHDDGVFYAARGFAFVVVDAMGRGDSEGEYFGFIRDGQDGFDVIEWVAQQAWCDGQVGMHGSSYTGWNQWRVLGELPPSLKTIVPAGAPMGALDQPRGGIPSLYGLVYATATLGRAPHWSAFRETGAWHDLLADAWRKNESEAAIREQLGFPSDPYEGMEDQIYPGNPWMEFLIPSEEALRGADVSVLSITGMYDDSQLGALYHHQRLLDHASESTKARSHLLIGPWDHYGTETGEPRVGELRFGPEAAVDLKELRAQWYAWAMKGGEKPALLTDPVVYFQTGDEEWRGGASLDDVAGPSRAYFLVPGTGSGEVFHSGALRDEPEAGPDYTFTADPADDHTIRLEMLKRPDEHRDVPTVPRTFNSLFLTSSGHDPTNAVFTTDLGHDGVVYHTAPLTERVRVVGRPRLSLRLTLNVPDADLMVLLHEVRGDGTVVFLSSDLLRLRFRALPEQPVFIEPEEPFDLDLNGFRFITRTLAEGSRLRLTVRNAHSVLLGKNPHTGKPAGLEEPRVAHYQVHHDAAQAPRLELPIA
ncbi:CocE/NonD family hydrolase [Actinoallomurus sp. CA-150999]|uniref:CocE/NonD family hydrolase n=1 Tax=Actinoallomurus sp. CA-150999 TaxID=3239887 RepID=UPI003D8DAFA5